MRLNRVIVILLLSTLILTALNWYARKKLPDSYAVQLSYNELYLDQEVLHIKSAQSSEQNLVMELAGDTAGLSSNLSPSHFTDNSTLSFTPNDHEQLFWIKQKGRIDSIHFSVNFSGVSAYKAAGNSLGSNFELNSSSLVFSEARLSSHHDWAFDFAYIKPQKREMLVYLADSVGIDADDQGLEILRKIYAHLMPVVQPNLGVPADSVSGKTPLELLGLLKARKVKVWCGNISTLLGAMTDAAGLSTRLISTEGYGSFSYPVHAFNEVYLPEYGSWAYTDPTNGIAFIGTADKPLNTIGLNRILRSGISTEHLNAVTFKDSIRSLSLDSFPAIFKSYFAAPQRFRFYYPRYLQEQSDLSVGSRIRKFLRPSYNFAFYSDDVHYGTGSFWLRAITGYLLIGAVFIGLFLLGVKLGSIGKTKRSDQ
ncbi:transglutaminase-like domain-containing protein [Terrimonas sp. NA20]|uniref:Transglutaminase-like domain-containing protein n=1 Tax=Terrimonas ginsenosidimutans TaxID=2908004 RepID=A0ABS9L0S8_9BACT|nr:transglutaminase-like domain-containing protein [Terrimonas ginsenosidimutans]MCG2618183.1 transglutaminase-like domain-containing protein [Terrimonas ginsenosidimutans]